MKTKPAIQRLHDASKSIHDDPAWRSITFDGDDDSRKYEKLIEARADLEQCRRKLQFLIDGTRGW